MRKMIRRPLAWACTALAATVQRYTVDRAPSYEERWSDHAPVVVDYLLP